MKKIQSEYDKAVKKGLLKKNTASRRKSRLAKIAKELKAGEKKATKVVKKTAKKVAKAAK